MVRKVNTQRIERRANQSVNKKNLQFVGCLLQNELKTRDMIGWHELVQNKTGLDIGLLS